MPNAAPLILVVDDVADLREMFYLATHGYRVIEAADAEDPGHAALLTEALVVAMKRAGARPVMVTAKGSRY
jgi:CheY-like chemotaxis protein